MNERTGKTAQDSDALAAVKDGKPTDEDWLQAAREDEWLQRAAERQRNRAYVEFHLAARRRKP